MVGMGSCERERRGWGSVFYNISFWYRGKSYTARIIYQCKQKKNITRHVSYGNSQVSRTAYFRYKETPHTWPKNPTFYWGKNVLFPDCNISFYYRSFPRHICNFPRYLWPTLSSLLIYQSLNCRGIHIIIILKESGKSASSTTKYFKCVFGL